MKAAVIAACSAGPVPWGTIQRACNIVAEKMFGDISRVGTTMPIAGLVWRLVEDGTITHDTLGDGGADRFAATLR